MLSKGMSRCEMNVLAMAKYAYRIFIEITAQSMTGIRTTTMKRE